MEGVQGPGGGSCKGGTEILPKGSSSLGPNPAWAAALHWAGMEAHREESESLAEAQPFT